MAQTYKKKSERGDLITRGGRKKSLQEAGVGRTDIIDARGGFKDSSLYVYI